MTREEAIAHGKEQILIFGGEHREFIEMSIKALEQEPCDVSDINVGDMISRQAVLDYIHRIFNQGTGKKKSFEYIQKYVEKLPPVNSTKTGWIPVSKKLPKAFEFVNCTCHSLVDNREDWVVETVYVPQPSDSPYSDWGNIPMLNSGDCEVIAWVHRDIPKPYKAESEESTVDAIPIPDGATNRDVIKELWHDETLLSNIEYCYGEEWLNAPYKEESEDRMSKETTCENCIYANECIMYEPKMKRCKDYKESEDK